MKIDNLKNIIRNQSQTNQAKDSKIPKLQIRNPFSSTGQLIGGFMIGLGGFYLWETIGADCDDCSPSELNKWLKDTEDIQKQGFFLIGLGGIIIGINAIVNISNSHQSTPLDFNFQPTFNGANLSMTYSFK